MLSVLRCETHYNNNYVTFTPHLAINEQKKLTCYLMWPGFQLIKTASIRKLSHMWTVCKTKKPESKSESESESESGSQSESESVS